MLIIVKPEYVIADKRGVLTQLVSGRSWSQLNAVERKGGTYGGGHYHRHAHELFYVTGGSGKLICINRMTRVDATLVFSKGDCFIIEPDEQHYFRFDLDTQLIALYTIAFDPEKTDTFVDDALPKIEALFNEQHQK